MCELSSLHFKVLGLLDDLEALTRQAGYDEAALSSLRYRLSVASGQRRVLVAGMLEARADKDGANREIAVLKQRILENRMVSTTHINRWSLREVAKDWTGYCEASRQIRARMRDQIEAEKLLYATH